MNQIQPAAAMVESTILATNISVSGVGVAVGGSIGRWVGVNVAVTTRATATGGGTVAASVEVGWGRIEVGTYSVGVAVCKGVNVKVGVEIGDCMRDCSTAAAWAAATVSGVGVWSVAVGNDVGVVTFDNGVEVHVAVGVSVESCKLDTVAVAVAV